MCAYFFITKMGKKCSYKINRALIYANSFFSFSYSLLFGSSIMIHATWLWLQLT